MSRCPSWFLVLSLVPSALVAQPPAPPAPAVQVAEAVLALPEKLRAGAAVLGYDASGALAQLRPGTNGLICLADDPADPRFHVACYHESLEPFMRRGRELRAAKVDRREIDRLREEEARAGTLPMPRVPAALYELTAPKDSFDVATRAVRSPAPMYVLYIPYATEATTGLSTAGAGGGLPWLMYPGRPQAHVMIIP